MNRQEHLDFCKKRALEYVDRGEFAEGITSMLSDLKSHPETEGVATTMAPLAMFELMNPSQAGARRFIEGFN